MFRISIATASDVILHLLSSQTSLVQPRLLSRVDFSEATVLSVYLANKDQVWNLVKLLKTFHSLPKHCPHLFQAKSHSSSPPSEMALQYVSYFMLTSTLEKEEFTILTVSLLVSTHGFCFSSSGWTIPIQSLYFSFAFTWQSVLPMEQAHLTWEWQIPG